jgi:hypothetical protein
MEHPASLLYATLPEGTAITAREDGENLIITVPAGDVPAEARRVARREAAIAAAVVSSVILMIAIGFSAPAVSRGWENLHWWWAVVFLALCAGVFALPWWVMYRRKIDAMQRVYRQATMLAVRSQRLVVETSGPGGQGSFDLTRMEIRDIKMVVSDREEAAGRWLGVFLSGGDDVRLLEGRSETEIRWVGREIRRVMGLRPPEAV